MIAGGEQPFETIMAAVGELEDGQALVVQAPFEPTPLEGVLSGQGFAYEATEIGGGTGRSASPGAGDPPRARPRRDQVR
ncbi:MAG: DUF2249 domain-containing protein [Acidimicrobiales bacterium]